MFNFTINHTFEKISDTIDCHTYFFSRQIGKFIFVFMQISIMLFSCAGVCKPSVQKVMWSMVGLMQLSAYFGCDESNLYCMMETFSTISGAVILMQRK